jgi:putative ABC transport system permease protein
MRALLRRFAYLVRWRQGQADLAEELAFHREMKEQELQDRLAIDRATATAAAKRELGSVALAMDRAHDVWVPAWLQGMGQDVRVAVRSFRGTPIVTLVALLTLALGIGANTAIFSFTKAILLAPLPYPNADRLVSLSTLFMPSGARSSMTPLDYFDYAESGVFERVSATTGCCGIGVIDTGSDPSAVIVLRVSAAYFDVFDAHAAMGRTFLPGEDQGGREHVAVLSHRTWVGLFGADPALIGRPIRLNRETYTVVGVMPANSPFDRSLTQIWVPLFIPPEQMNRTNHWLISSTGAAVGLLKPGMTLERGRAQLAAVAARLANEYPETNAGSGVVLEPYAAVIVNKNAKDLLSMLSAAVGAVLLIGCVNLAAVLLARGVARNRELAIRTALGAARGRLVRQLLTESLLLSICGGVLGLAVASVLMTVLEAAVRSQALNPSMPPNWIPAEAVIGLDPYVMSFTLLVSLLAAVAFGLMPAIWHTRRPAGDALSIHTQASVRGTPRALHNVLLIAEFALAFVLLTGAGLIARSFVKMQQADTGFSATNVITAALPIPEHRFRNDDELRAYEERMIAAIEPLPGVRNVAVTDGLPLQGVPTGRGFQILGRPTLDQARRPQCDLKIVSAGYFPAMGLRLRAGRTLREGDRLGAPFVVVINETMERMHFAGTDPIGQHIVTGDARPGTTEEIPWTIVGVIADERLTPFDDHRERPAVYVPLGQLATPFVAGVVVHTAGDPDRLRDAIRHAITANDRDQLIWDMKTVPQLESEALGPARLRTGFLGVFATIALLLSAIGIYGVFAYAVAQRTHEIGIRMALGARSRHLTWMVVRRAIALIVVGLALGLVGAFGGMRFLQAFLFGVAPADLATLTGAAALLAVVALVACLVPARRATKIDIVSALRAD